MVKIAFLIDTIEYPTAGTEKQILLLLKHLNKDKFLPILCVLRLSEWLEKEFDLCPVKEIGIYSFKNPIFVYKMLSFSQFLKKEKIDILQCHFRDSNIIGPIAAKLAGLKKVISARRDQGHWLNNVELKILKVINRWVMLFFVNSKSTKEWAMNIFKIPEKKIKVIYNSIDLEPFERLTPAIRLEYRNLLKVHNNAPIVGIVANLRRVKGIDIFLKAARIVKTDSPDAQFIIVGEGDQRGELERIATELGLTDCTQFLGSRNDIPQLLSAFDVGVLSSYSESFSNSVIEYITAGLPVVCTDVGGATEVVRNGVNGYVVNIGDHKAIAECIKSIIKNNATNSRGMGIDKKLQEYSISEGILSYEKEILAAMGQFDRGIQNVKDDLKARIIPPEQIMSPEIISAWEEMLKCSKSLYVQYCSYHWYHVLQKASIGKTVVVGVFNRSNLLCGLVIFVQEPKTLFVGPSRIGLKINIDVLSVLGDILVNGVAISRVLDAALLEFSSDHVVCLKSFPVDSNIWKADNLKKKFGRKYNILMYPERKLYLLHIPPSIADYYSTMDSKKRWQLKKKTKILNNEASGELNLIRFTQSSEVEEFIKLSRSILQNAWQNENSNKGAYISLNNNKILIAAAEEKMFRSYVLMCGQKPCAFVVGYQYRDIYHYSDLAFDQNFSKGSPGLVALHLLIQDLIENDSPKILNYGIEEARYKLEFSNAFINEKSVFLFQKSIKGYALEVLNNFFWKGKQIFYQ